VATAEQKAHKILAEGRLTVERVDATTVVARCRGFSDGEVYALGFDPRANEWRCTCPASRDFHRRCSHLLALQLVVLRPSGAAATI
jgi:uncharacterized Zn finger protein